jgi:hypothetical protein
MNIITQSWNALVKLVRPDVDAIIAGFLKAQSKLDGFISRETAKLEAETKAIVALTESRVARNATIDRAYRIIHNLDGLVA